MEHYITKFVNEVCQLIAGRATTRAAQLRVRPDTQINPDHIKEGRAAALERLADQFKELGTTPDSEALIAKLIADNDSDEFPAYEVDEFAGLDGPGGIVAAPAEPGVIRGKYVEDVPGASDAAVADAALEASAPTEAPAAA